MGGSRTSLEVYVVDFEEMLLSSTADFYRRAAPPLAQAPRAGAVPGDQRGNEPVSRQADAGVILVLAEARRRRGE